MTRTAISLHHARAGTLAVLVLTAILAAGCTGDRQDPHTESAPERVETPFCKYSQQQATAKGIAYRVTGCPQTLLATTETLSDTARVPENTTGLRFTFVVSLLEPYMEARIVVRDGAQIVLEDDVAFVAGTPVKGQGSSDPDLDDMTRTTQLVFSYCGATEVALEWGPTPAQETTRARVQAHVDPAFEAAPDGRGPTCNGYWTAE